MRQWACVVALLLGLAGNGYASTSRSRLPIPMERRLEPALLGTRGAPGSRGRSGRTLDWWRA